MATITIPSKYCGPPDSGNGGYVCGVIAKYAAFEPAVMLRKPPPLDKPLTIVTSDDKVLLMDGDVVIAEAVPDTLDIEPPPAPDFETAHAASANYICFEDHVFPTCFVCGPHRKAGDGLRIFAGKVADQKVVAAPWTPFADVANEEGLVRTEFHWAALDCPGYFGITDVPTKKVLGKMSARVVQRVKVSENCVVIGWPIQHDGRKHFSGTAIYREDGTLAAMAKAVWIDI